MASQSRKSPPPAKKGKAVPEPFFAALDDEAEAILDLLDRLCNARADTSSLMDALQIRFAQRAAVDEDVLLIHAETSLTKPAEQETLARATLRLQTIDALLARGWMIDSGPARRAWCALLESEAKGLFADESALRGAFKPADLRDLHRDAAKVRDAVAAAFRAR